MAGLMDGLMDQISNHSNLEREAVGLPDRRPTRRVRRVAAAGVALAVLAAFTYLGFFHHREARAVAPPAALPLVTVSKPLQRAVDTRLGFLGQFSAVDRIEVRAQVGGTLTEIHFKDGQIVHKGDLLFVIDPRPYEIKLAQANAQLQTAKARVAFANNQLTRAQSLRRNEFATQETVDQRTSDQDASAAAVEDAKARIRDAQLDLEYCRVIAPFTGRIGARQVSIGSLVAGSRAAVSPTTLLATLVSLDPSSGTIHARATVPNHDLFLAPGQFARLSVTVAPPAQAALLPDSAVVLDQSQHLVMTVAADGTVTPKIVQTGELRGGLRVINSGLEPGDRVVVDGLVRAIPGTKVAPQDGAIRYDAAADGQG